MINVNRKAVVALHLLLDDHMIGSHVKGSTYINSFKGRNLSFGKQEAMHCRERLMREVVQRPKEQKLDRRRQRCLATYVLQLSAQQKQCK
jgi:hypothetical protein